LYVRFSLNKINIIPFKFGFYTGLFIVISLILKHYVIYDALKLDYYLVFAAICFFSIGYFLKNDKTDAAKELKETVPAQNEVQLTARELQILKYIASGKSNKEIALLNCVELSTIKTHINNLYAKLSVSNRQEAVKKYGELVRKEQLT